MEGKNMRPKSKRGRKCEGKSVREKKKEGRSMRGEV